VASDLETVRQNQPRLGYVCLVAALANRSSRVFFGERLKSGGGNSTFRIYPELTWQDLGSEGL